MMFTCSAPTCKNSIEHPSSNLFRAQRDVYRLGWRFTMDVDGRHWLCPPHADERTSR